MRTVVSRAFWIAITGVAAQFASLGTGQAQQPAPATPAPSPAAPSAPAAAKPAEIRRDPAGIKGVSPVWESLKLGDASFVARDYDAAIKYYKEAITKEPQHPLGHLRMAEVLIQKGTFVEAAQAAATAERFAAKHPTLGARALFLIAWMHEQQQQWEEAIAAWNAYAKYAREQSKAKVFQRTPPERLKRIQDSKQLKQDSAAVKERIEKRLKEAEEKARRSAQ
ncbi:MAG TPA: tetratricopeptide repeat protein [Polyangiaceae bacterium]